MKVLVSVDMEGVCGVVDGVDVRPGDPEHERNRRLMTAEASAAVRGVLVHSPDAEVVVADAHAQYRNLLPDELDERAHLVRGKPRALGMMTGLDHDVDAVVFVGYHGKEGTAGSVLAHTINGAVVADVRWDGRSYGELGLNAALAAHFDAAPVLVVGDDAVALEAADVDPGIHTVVVKHALGASAARSLHPAEACRRIEAAVPAALDDRASTTGPRHAAPIAVEVELFRPRMLEHLALVPGFELVAPRTVGFTAADALEAYRLVRLAVVLAGAT